MTIVQGGFYRTWAVSPIKVSACRSIRFSDTSNACRFLPVNLMRRGKVSSSVLVRLVSGERPEGWLHWQKRACRCHGVVQIKNRVSVTERVHPMSYQVYTLSPKKKKSGIAAKKACQCAETKTNLHCPHTLEGMLWGGGNDFKL